MSDASIVYGAASIVSATPCKEKPNMGGWKFWVHLATVLTALAALCVIAAFFLDHVTFH
ncbi:MAG TPA: hypothetical protein VKB71_11365 [Rhizomicrobium sp.]|nr:hypothetical protein [Rhizomicrobium sp.]